MRCQLQYPVNPGTVRLIFLVIEIFTTKYTCTFQIHRSYRDLLLGPNAGFSRNDLVQEVDICTDSLYFL